MGADNLFIGLISGTSADGIDAALVSFADQSVSLIHHHLHPFPATTRQRLISLFTPANDQLDLMGELDRELGELFAEAALSLMAQAGVSTSQIRAIGSHGQTVRHRPAGAHPFTLQIGDPNVIAQLTGLDVVADFRRRDMACGGQGAPLAPLFHQAFLAAEDKTRVMLNLGGIANITLLPGSANAGRSGTRALAMDTGPASGLLDAWCQLHRGCNYDEGGHWAKTGCINEALLARWLADPYFDLPAPKSTGKEYFHLPWAEQLSQGLMHECKPQDIQATLLELSARSIVDAIHRCPIPVDEVMVCGGGTHNSLLMARLQELAACPVQSSMALGIDPDWVEAMCFAWLAQCNLEGRKLDTSAFTGAREPVLLGALFKG